MLLLPFLELTISYSIILKYIPCVSVNTGSEQGYLLKHLKNPSIYFKHYILVTAS